MATSIIRIGDRDFKITDNNSDQFLQEIAADVNKRFEEYKELVREYPEDFSAMALTAYEFAYKLKIQAEEIDRLTRLANPNARTLESTKRSYNGSKRSVKTEKAELVSSTTDNGAKN